MKKRPILNAYEMKIFKEWIADGNAVETEKGVWLEQTTQYRKKFTYEELQNFFKKEYLSYNGGGSAKEISSNTKNKKEKSFQLKAYNVGKIDYKINPTDEGLENIFKNIISKETHQARLQGVNFDINGATGTDGYKLVHIVGKKVGSFENGTYYPFTEIAKTYEIQSKEIKKAVSLSKYFNTRGLIEESYPNWMAVVPKSYDYAIPFNLPTLYDILKSFVVSKMLNEITNAVILEFKTKDGLYQIGFNAKILMHTIESLMRTGIENVTGYFTAPSRAVIFVDSKIKVKQNEKDAFFEKNTFGLVMPIMTGSEEDLQSQREFMISDGKIIVIEFPIIRYISSNEYEIQIEGMDTMVYSRGKSIQIKSKKTQPKATPQSTTKTTDKKTALGNKLRKGMVVRIEYKESNGSTLSNDLFFDDGKFIKYILITDKKGKEISETEETLSETELNDKYTELSEFIVAEFYENMADGGQLGKQMTLFNTGGKIGFDALANKVAKRYAGQKVESKYQAEYGKKYSKSEAEEVGRKVAGKVYRQQQGRKFNGGGKAIRPSLYSVYKVKDKMGRVMYLNDNELQKFINDWNEDYFTDYEDWVEFNEYEMEFVITPVFSKNEMGGDVDFVETQINDIANWENEEIASYLEIPVNEVANNREEYIEEAQNYMLVNQVDGDYAMGGIIGNEVDFMYYGEPRKGKIIEDFGDSYGVQSGSSQIAVDKEDITNIYETKKERFYGLFKNGGSLDKKYNFDDYGIKSYKELIDAGKFRSKFKSISNASDFNRIKFNRMRGKEQVEYVRKLNKQKIQYNLKLNNAEETFYTVKKEVFDYANIPETEEKNFYTKFDEPTGFIFADGGDIEEIKTKYQIAGSDKNGVYTYSKRVADEIAKIYGGDVQEDGSNWYVRLEENYADGGEVLASSSSKEGINKLIEQYLYGSTIKLVQTDNDKIYEVHNKKGKTSFYVEFSRGKYKFIQPSKFNGGGGVGEPYDSMTKYQIEKEYKKLNEKRRLLIDKYGDFESDEILENEKEIDKIITLLYGENFSGKGQKFKYADGGKLKEYNHLKEYYEKYVNGGFVGGDIIKFKYDGKEFTRKVESVDDMGNALVNLMKTQKATINPADIFDIKKDFSEKDVIIKKIGLNENLAEYLVTVSPTFAVWFADAIVENEIEERQESKEVVLKAINEKSISKNTNYFNNNFGGAIREILDWLQHPSTPKQNLRDLSFNEALEKSRQWHQELTTSGGDLNFVEPDENTILITYPPNEFGKTYYWVFIPKNYCDIESSRMGHCGRTGAGSLISLRSFFTNINNESVTDSHVTIAYNKDDGLFYQAKGKQNKKPIEKYFPYIFDLIKMMASGQVTENFKLTQQEKIKELEGQKIEYEKGVNELQKYFESEEARIENVESLVEKAGVLQEVNKKLENINSQIEKLNEESSFDFNGFRSEYQSSNDYGYEDMTNEQVKELYGIKPDMFNDFAGQFMLYEAGLVDEAPNTIFTIEKDVDYVVDLLRVDRSTSDSLVTQVLSGETYDLINADYYYEDANENAGNYVDELKRFDYDSVIDKIVEITAYDKEEVKENGAEYYLNGEDENFDSDSFDDIKRAIGNALAVATEDDYVTYLRNQIVSALEELGTIKKLDDTGLVLSVDLSNLLGMSVIDAYMKDLESESLEDVFFEAKSQGEIELPELSIDDRYEPYPDDWQEYFDINNYEEGGAVYPDLSMQKAQVVNDSFRIPEFELKQAKDVLEINGLTNKKITSSNDSVDIFRSMWGKDTINAYEQAYVIFLNKGMKPIGYYHHSSGGIDGTIMDIQMISGMAVKSLAKGVIIAHNHPSGNTKPSDADERITTQMKQALKLFNIQLIDSIILTENSSLSFADEGYL